MKIYSWFVVGSMACLSAGCSPAPNPNCGDPAGISDPACQTKQFCGGIAGIACPGSGVCIDDPSDGCDPKRGGADCSGMCVCDIRATCVKGSEFDPSPSVCACVPTSVDPCATVRCGSGTHCEVAAGKAVCAPDTNPCAAVLCITGSECVADETGAHCVPIVGVACGKTTCAAGQYCCNASCSMCAPRGVACIQIACE